MKKSNQAKLSKRKQKEISKCMKHLMPNSTIVMGNIKPSERDTPFERVGKWPLWEYDFYFSWKLRFSASNAKYY